MIRAGLTGGIATGKSYCLSRFAALGVPVQDVDGVRDLVRLLDRVRDDRPRGLLAVPGAVAAQAPRQLLQLFERLP